MFLTVGLASTLLQAHAEDELKTQKEKVSYSIGLNIGRSWKAQYIDVNPDLVIKGIEDVLKNAEPKLTAEEVAVVKAAFQKELQVLQQEKRKEATEKNIKEGEEFLAANKSKEGVITLPSGVQYKILAEGAGEPPAANDTVTMNYRGRFADGKEFDSSYSRNQPARFAPTGVVKGWGEAIQLMKPGAKWEIYVAGPLAYGEAGAGHVIPPNKLLIFECELVEVKRAAAPNQPVTSDIIRVPSAEELKQGAKIEVIKPEDLEKLKKEQQEKK